MKRNKLQAYLSVFLVFLIVVIVSIGGRFYIVNVQDSLWRLSVDDLKEITAQSGHAFEVYLRKDQQNIHGLAVGLSQIKSDDTEYISSRLEAFDDVSTSAFYTIVDMEKEVFYSTVAANFCSPLPENRMEAYRAFSGNGVEEPYISGVNGLQTLGCYECFTFADGVPGIVRCSTPTFQIAREFSLSLFDRQGFSYVVSAKGDILIRPERSDSSITYHNIFDIMELEGAEGSTKISSDFRASLAEGKAGVVRFTSTRDRVKYIYAYEPLNIDEGWYMVSVVPNDVIMKQGNHILRLSNFFSLAVCVLGLVLLAIAFLIWQNRQAMKKIDLEVLYREQLFNTLTRSTGDVFVMYTACDKNVEYVSPNVEQVLGIPAKQIQDNLFVLQSADDIDSVFLTGLADLKPGEVFFMQQERIHKKTGEHRWFSLMVYRVTIEAEDKVILVLSDRTAEKQKEHVLEEAMTIAQEANRSKSTFLSNMSHDIRTPMNAIVGLCTLLYRDSEYPERVRDYTKKITASSQHLLSLINDVLDMSKIESGKTTLNIAEISLAEIIESLNTIIRPQAKAKQQTFEISTFDLKNEQLLGDKLRINQIFINMISNAVKYTPEGGKIELIIRELPQITKNFARLRFVIRDNGIGMSKNYMKTIFEPFTREINSTTNKIQGTGLGMPITKSLVELMGGTISVESAPNKGSTFTVELQLRIQEQDVDSNFWQSYGVTRALVVDDEIDICSSVISAMDGTGVSMQFALNGPDAIRAVKQGHDNSCDFDLVLIDWKMPEMNGIETARHIRKILPEDTPILILTAYDWEDIKDEAQEAGVDGFLSKPFFASNLKLTVERLRNEEKSIAPKEARVMEGMHILAAEDNELNSEILKELLSMEGASCDIMEDGEKVLERFKQSKPGQYDLILMDIQMPRMNGYEAARAIRACEHPKAKTIPIIAMTADAFVEDVCKAMEAGMDKHMSKPIELEKLEEAIRDVMK